ncbi:MAG: tetratricopeptide repeat protein [Thermotogota bacterium]
MTKGELIQKGDYEYSKGRIEKAIEYYEKALKKDHLSFEINSKLGTMRMNIRDYNGAIKAYKKALKSNPDNSQIYFFMGNAYQAMGRINEAIRTYEELLEKIEYDQYGFWSILTELYKENNEKEKAQDLYNEKLTEAKKSIEKDPENSESYHKMAIVNRFECDHEKAVKNLEKAIKLNEIEPIYYSEIVDSLIKLSDLDQEKAKDDPYINKAIDILKSATEKLENSKKVYEELSNVYLMSNQNKKAAETLKKLLEKYPDYDEVYYRYHNILDKYLENYQEIIDTFSNLYERYPKNPKIIYCLINGYLRKEKYDKAQEIAEKAIKNETANHMVMLSLGFIHEEKKNYNKAENFYNSAINENPFFFDAYFKLMLFYNKQNEKDKMKETIERMKKVGPMIKDPVLKKRFDEMIKNSPV